jgi:hypothetical protein
MPITCLHPTPHSPSAHCNAPPSSARPSATPAGALPVRPTSLHSHAPTSSGAAPSPRPHQAPASSASYPCRHLHIGLILRAPLSNASSHSALATCSRRRAPFCSARRCSACTHHPCSTCSCRRTPCKSLLTPSPPAPCRRALACTYTSSVQPAAWL